jgi:3-isopropylmalate/(R)-2-methylmalate dehydratase small subunit
MHRRPEALSVKNIAGRVAYVFAEDDFDVDQIVGVKNIKLQDAEALARVAMERFDPEFRSKVRPGDVLVGGRNFGYGHPHYPAMKAMRHMGVAAVIAESFFPVYWRGEIGMGFPQISREGILEAVKRWDEVEIDWAASVVRIRRSGQELSFAPHSRAERAMLEAGGFKAYLRQRMEQDGTAYSPA